MNQMDLISIAVLGGALLLGAILGFGRSLKIFTGGIFGIIISVFVCVMIGGTIMNIEFVSSLVARGDEYFTNIHEFLGYLHVGTIIYYIALFLVVQIARIIVIKIITGLGKSKNALVKLVSSLFGAIFMCAFCLGLSLIFFAVIKNFDTAPFSITVLDKIADSYLFKLYEINPIKFNFNFGAIK